MTRVGFIGTGNMGRPMIDKLLEAGYPVSVYDFRTESARSVIEKGAEWHDSPRSAANNCDIVITCLPLPEDVYENMVGDEGALAGMKSSSVWIDTSTTDYHNTLDVASQAKSQGIYSLEAPASNLSHMGVDFANASFFVGGPLEAYKRCEIVLNEMGVVSFHVGGIGQAQSVKLLTNLLFYTAVVAVGDALLHSRFAGVPAHQAWKCFVRSPANSVAIEQFAPFLLDGSFDSSCSLEIAVKDMALTVQMADELKTPMPLGRVIESRYRHAGLKYDRYDNHLRVVEARHTGNGVHLKVPGYSAPSKYGIDPSYPIDQEFTTDQVGRVKPKREHQFPLNDIPLDDDQVKLLDTLIDDLVYVNRQILDEAYDLGRGMGLKDSLIYDVVTWSVGASNWSDSLMDECGNELMSERKKTADEITSPNLTALFADNL
ncbi:NAD(P)-dependent oxidoreductase [Billgrantia endophytica]|nr:NAD(P)-dependent oxidoreductase [Halomonas endophytica]